MKKVYAAFLLIFSLTVFQGYGQKVINDVNAQVRHTGSFSAVVVNGAIDLYISQSGSHALAVSAQDAASRDMINTEVRNNTLYISVKGKSGWELGDKKMKAYIAAPVFSKIQASGSCDIFIDEQLKGDDMEVMISGSSDFKGRLVVKNLKLTASGSSDLVISGSAVHLKVEVSGSSDLKGFGLSCDYCDIMASGACDVSITANKELKAKASGSSDINYRGSAVVREALTSGASEIKKKGK